MGRGRGRADDRPAAGLSPVPTERAGGWPPDVVLGLGWLAVVVESGLVVAGGDWGEFLWIASTTVALATATLVRARRPDLALSSWFGVLAGGTAFIQLFDLAVSALDRLDASAAAIATSDLLAGLSLALTAVAAMHLFVTFPDGRPTNRWERWVPRASWGLFAVPVLLAMATPVVSVPWYVDIPPAENVYHVLPGVLDRVVAGTVETWLNQFVVIAWILLGLRYRRLGHAQRRQVRWLLVPVLLSLVAVALSLVVGEDALALVGIVSIGLSAMTGIAVAIALLRPEGVDVDRVLRRSLVYGVLWVAIAGAYSAAATTVGFAAGRRLSIGWAILLTVVATLLFQPARARLEVLADRWVFGSRGDPTQVIARLGATLAETYDLQTLLPRMAATLEDGLGLTWARVHLDGRAAPASSHDAPPPTPPVLAVPIELEGEHLGTVECGPRLDGDLTDDDRLVVETLARQAALAVRNVRLTAELARQADRLAASRTRLVRAQEVERRRIERNIHDGVQQELVALISQAGQVGRDLDHDPEAAVTDLADLQVGLRRVLNDLRELAAGIHPSLLSDRGLLAAVESLAARNPVPVTLRADPRLRSLRASEEVEGAGYFTVAEALANSLKHAEASCVDVTLSRAGDSLHITVHDDGRGFGVGAGLGGDGRFGGNGLSNLAERVTALGGEFQVVGGPDRGTTVTAVLPVGRS